MDFGETALGLNLPELATGLAAAVAAGFAWWMRRRADTARAQTERERHLRVELEAYAALDARMAEPGMSRELAGRICRTVSEKSVFRRVMLLMRNADGRLPCVGSIGVDDLTVAALERWGEKVVAEERDPEGAAGEKTGMARDGALLGKSAAFQIQLGQWSEFDEEIASWKMSGRTERRQWRRALVMPVRARAQSELRAGRLVGALVVCSDGLRLPPADRKGRPQLDQLMGPLEMLAAQLGRAVETAELQARLVRAEKLAGLGQLAGSVAEALENPLTVVLGYAEIMAETAAEPRAREHARTILDEAGRMKATVARLGELSQPAPIALCPLDLVSLLRRVTQLYAVPLAERGVRLEVTSQRAAAMVNGTEERLTQLLHSLLDHALHSIAAAHPQDVEHVVRVSLSQDGLAIHLIVSHTGVQTQDPAHAFEPRFSATEVPGGGLAVCPGIVREHGGEIAAFPLHPHGGAVVVDLPVHHVADNITPGLAKTEPRNKRPSRRESGIFT